MIFSAFEISGNVCVDAAFIIFPGNNLPKNQEKGVFLYFAGLPWLICIICMVKVMWLRWVWVKVVRRQMRKQIDQNDQ
jgi:hypothetical protein